MKNLSCDHRDDWRWRWPLAPLERGTRQRWSPEGRHLVVFFSLFLSAWARNALPAHSGSSQPTKKKSDVHQKIRTIDAIAASRIEFMGLCDFILSILVVENASESVCRHLRLCLCVSSCLSDRCTDERDATQDNNRDEGSQFCSIDSCQ